MKRGKNKQFTLSYANYSSLCLEAFLNYLIYSYLLFYFEMSIVIRNEVTLDCYFFSSGFIVHAACYNLFYAVLSLFE